MTGAALQKTKATEKQEATTKAAEASNVSEMTDDTKKELEGKIEFVNWMAAESGVTDELIAMFNEEYPNIEVESTSVAFADVRKDLIARYAAGMSADVYQLNMPWGQELVDLGALEPLDALMEADVDFDKSALVQEPMREVSGSSYMVPMTAMHFVLFCNLDHFEEAGLELPTTWEEMEAAAKKLTDPDNNRYGFSLSMASSGAANGPILSLYPLLYSAGGRTIKDGMPNIDSPEVLGMMQLVDRMYADGSILPGTLTKSGNQVLDDFISGTASMMIQPSVHVSTVKRNGEGVNFDVVRVPGPANGSVEASRLHGWEVGISSGSENKELAWTFISFVTRPDINAWLGEKSGQLPANLKADATYINEDPHLKKTFDMMSELEMVEELMTTPKSTDTWRVYTENTQRMFLDEISPEEAVKNIQQGWEELFGQ